MPLDPMIARPYVPDVSNTLGEIARLKVADQYRQAQMQQQQAELGFQRQKYGDAQARQAAEDAEDDMVAELLKTGRLKEAMAIDPDTALQFMQASGIDPQTLLAKERITQDQSQFDKRMQVDQSQFDADLGLRRQDMAADQAYRNQSLDLQRQQESRLAAAAGAASANNPMGLNERQQGGLAMRRDNAVMYAANLTGMSPLAAVHPARQDFRGSRERRPPRAGESRWRRRSPDAKPIRPDHAGRFPSGRGAVPECDVPARDAG
jgi:hypothetical protein